MFVPHFVPFASVAPLSHTGSPVEQSVVPGELQALGGSVHDPPSVHEPHDPSLQYMLVPHDVPLASWLFVLVQTEVPEEHTVVQTVQASAGVQTVPVVHAMHAPLSQTSFVPHPVPLVTLAEPTQVETPVEHEVVPVWQPLVVVHAVPAVHEVHAPLSQTSFAPHDVPLATLEVLPHTPTPVEQEMVPVSQPLFSVHAAPVVHEVHAPLSQTSFVPHDVPLARFVVPTHTEMPEEHEVIPAWHPFVVVHGAFATHELHVPLSQTSFVPQDVPLATSPETLHTTPLEQACVPVVHGLPVEHVAPVVHAVHDPALQTSFVPQDVPLPTFVF
jgi:hypothetical protein